MEADATIWEKIHAYSMSIGVGFLGSMPNLSIGNPFGTTVGDALKNEFCSYHNQKL